eukprot:2168760-Amphidinium_carterae.1
MYREAQQQRAEMLVQPRHRSLVHGQALGHCQREFPTTWNGVCDPLLTSGRSMLAWGVTNTEEMVERQHDEERRVCNPLGIAVCSKV